MYFTVLTDNNKKIIQPNAIKINLLDHQKTLIYKMFEIDTKYNIKIKITENFKKRFYENYNLPIEDTIKINTNVAILGDKVGSGKTLMVITLITIKKFVNDTYINFEEGEIKLHPDEILINSNLIIIPNKLTQQWEKSFEEYSPNLKIYVIQFKKDIEKICKFDEEQNNYFVDYEYLNKYDVIIITDTAYLFFCLKCKNYRFDKIFIDDFDSIKFSIKYLNFNFLWLITSNPIRLFDVKRTLMSKIFSCDDFSYLDFYSCLVIKNDDSYIEKSMNLSSPKLFKIKCLNPIEFLIKDLIPFSVLQKINEGNTEDAIKELNCNIDTNENILQVISKNLLNEIEIKKKELENEMINNDQLININNQLEKLNYKYENLKKKIFQIYDIKCPICMDDYTNRVIVSCCNNTFCFDCLAVSLGELKNNKCPCCRCIITKENIHFFENEKIIKNKIVRIPSIYDPKDKLDVLIDIIKNKSDGSFIIYAGYTETFKIIDKLENIKVSFHMLKGRSDIVKKYIDNFNNKKIRVLILNPQFFGKGMNLQNATDIIIYNRFSLIEEQIIGRVQRLGRTIEEPVNVYYLLHDKESNIIKNNFNFDETEIHYINWLEQYKFKKNTKANAINYTNNYLLSNKNYNEINIDDDDYINKIIKDNNLNDNLLNSNENKLINSDDIDLLNLDDFNTDQFEVIKYI